MKPKDVAIVRVAVPEGEIAGAYVDQVSAPPRDRYGAQPITGTIEDIEESGIVRVAGGFLFDRQSAYP